MNKEADPACTKVVGYFNPNSWSIYFEVSELNLRCELKPNQYITDRAGHYINDPVFEDYVQPKGLSRATGTQDLPFNYVPRVVKSARPIHAVTQASGFVRTADGSVMPTYTTPPPTVAVETPANKAPILGMSMTKARELGLVGKPRLVPEDYGVADSSGAPDSSAKIPDIRYSIESNPKVRTAAPLTPELMEADARLSPQEAAHRAVLQQSLNQVANQPMDEFNPAAVGPTPVSAVAAAPVAVARRVSAAAPPLPEIPAPVRMRAPKEPAPIRVPSAAHPLPEIPQRVLAQRVATVVAPRSEEEFEPAEASGVMQPLSEGQEMPNPILGTPPVSQPDGDTEKRFVCAADGRPFHYRSELDRYVRRKYPTQYEQLMSAYPAEHQPG
jgi:hypothetical protein